MKQLFYLFLPIVLMSFQKADIKDSIAGTKKSPAYYSRGLQYKISSILF